MSKGRRKRRSTAKALLADTQQPPLQSPVLLAGLILVVTAATVATHWPALTAKAISFDDSIYLVDNRLVQSPGWHSAGRFLGEVLEPSTVGGYYQPLTMISLMLDCALGGSPDNLMPFHRTSLALHAANTGLVILFLYLLFGRPWPAALAGLLFGLHPLTVEPIPWVGERKTLLAAFFALSCLCLYVRHARRPGRWTFVAAVALFVPAVLAKPTSVPLPVALLLLDHWPLRRRGWRAALEKLPFFAIAGISAVVAYISQARTAVVVAPGEYAPLRIPLTICHNIVFYLFKIVRPVDLSSHYPFPPTFSPGEPMILAGLIGTAVLIVVLIVSRRWTPALWVGWAIFFVVIFPALGVVGFTRVIAADKFAYLPAVGLLVTLAWGLGRLWDARALWRRGAVVAAVLALAAGEVILTRKQLAHWQTSESLFRHMISLTPEVPMLHYNLANALRDQGRIDEAIAEYRLAVSMEGWEPYGRKRSRLAEAHNNLANLLVQRGKLSEAMEHWRQSLRIRPKSFRTHSNLARGLMRQGNFAEAETHLREAIRLNPNEPSIHVSLGDVLQRLGFVNVAILEYQAALRIDPAHPAALRRLRDARKE